METRELKTICTKSKLGHSLSQISELTGLTVDQVKQQLGQATGISPDELSSIFDMKQRGLSLELISQEFDVELEVLKQFLPQVTKKAVQTHALADQGKGPYDISLGERAYTPGSPCKSKSPHTTTEETKHPQPTTPHHTFLYSFQDNTNQLHRVNLLTGEKSSHKVPHYQFKRDCRWSELPGGSLLFTGGFVDYRTSVRDVVRVDALREYAVCSQPPMHTARHNHAAVYHSQYVYVLGTSECERYSCAESRWEVLPALPVAGAWMSGVEVENNVYALGGFVRSRLLDTVQKLSLDSLTWQLMQLKLPQAARLFPCFKTETQVYLVIKKTLYSFTPLEVKRIKTLDTITICHSSYYSRGTLYYECGGSIRSLALKLG
jgi:hypothetical protein